MLWRVPASVIVTATPLPSRSTPVTATCSRSSIPSLRSWPRTTSTAAGSSLGRIANSSSTVTLAPSRR